MKVLVTGAAGNVGSVVVAELLKRGAEVRALIRKPDADHKLPASVEVAIGDLLDPVSIEEAMKGVDKLFLLNAVVADELTQALIAYGIAKRIGLKHVTYLSVFKVQEFRDVPHFASKLAVEGALREFGVPYTILRPGYYMQNDIGLKDALTGPGLYPMPLGTAGIAAADVRDIAEAAAISLTEKVMKNRPTTSWLPRLSAARETRHYGANCSAKRSSTRGTISTSGKRACAHECRAGVLSISA
jgi:uncharacterized protein YbjT (DUF2867 family)